MKTIAIHCTCGSSITFTDNAESYIHGKTGEPDKRGRRFLIEVRADEWQARHADCLKTRIQLLTTKPNKSKPAKEI